MKQKLARILKLSRKIEKLAAEADELELTLPNGALAGNMLAGIAADILLNTGAENELPSNA